MMRCRWRTSSYQSYQRRMPIQKEIEESELLKLSQWEGILVMLQNRPSHMGGQ
jgi:hypothetical protein